ncbi:dihydrolipoyl dehydrogenase [Temperatibacter marinus]|uniref:Dihydrolipoyl dehydrogenase n=1 Tax=Temperatibacter marinus TaxID=1456591 RepID=A0AA52H8A8_9PROT|nr:dihydrolipoyl dehydrogenase [Temperatibacter marinus]WND01644.1 dihydrolipoyl dehydrogenase [Temperatibacter marinus]
MSEYDVVVIGAGPGGYVAAIRAAQLGLKTACVEKRETLGGTCLNVGCMPSKALLNSSHHYHEAKHGTEKFGFTVKGVDLDLPSMMKSKDDIVNGLTGGIEFLFKKNKITWIKGTGTFSAKDTLDVTLNAGGTEKVKAKNFIVATGSDVASLPGIEIDETTIVSSTGGLELKDVPKKMVVIGGGVIGMELGSVWQRLGAEVEVVEFQDQLLFGMDTEVRKNFGRMMKKQGFKLHLSSKVTGVEKTKSGATVTFEPVKGGDSKTIDCDIVLMSVGRRPYTDSLGLETVGVEMDDRGRIKINHDFSTNVPSIWAIGDVVEGPMLAHKAEDEGVCAAENIAGETGYVNHDVIPGVVYTHPEVASVGKSEDELKEAGVKYTAGKFPFTANSRAKANQDTDGFVKILADKETDRILGVHIIGADAGNMIAQAATAMEFGASAEDIALTCHAHPTETEAMKEAALAVHGRPIHM